MQDTFTQKFFEWCTLNNISREEIAQATGNSKQTISNWRSNGIPKGKQLGLEGFMRDHCRQEIEDIRSKMILHPTHEQFTRWNKAALYANKTIEEWAFDGLETMAAEYYLDIAEDSANGEEKPG